MKEKIDLSDPTIEVSLEESDKAVRYLRAIEQQGDVDSISISGTISIDDHLDVSEIIEKEMEKEEPIMLDQIDDPQEIIGAIKDGGIESQEIVEEIAREDQKMFFEVGVADEDIDKAVLAENLQRTVQDHVDAPDTEESESAGAESISDQESSEESNEAPEFPGGQKGRSHTNSESDIESGGRKKQAIELLWENQDEWIDFDDFVKEFDVSRRVGSSALSNCQRRVDAAIEKRKELVDGSWRSQYRYSAEDDSSLGELKEEIEVSESMLDEDVDVGIDDIQDIRYGTKKHEVLSIAADIDRSEESEWFHWKDLSGFKQSTLSGTMSHLKDDCLLKHNMEEEQWAISELGKEMLEVIESRGG